MKFIFTKNYFHRKTRLFTKILYYENWNHKVAMTYRTSDPNNPGQLTHYVAM